MPSVSIVIPAFNAAATIERSVRSILDQTLQNTELIVVDDGSTDDTADIVTSISVARIRLIRVAHCGVASAANIGTRHATSDFIARMDADDWSCRTRLERQLHALQDQRLDAVGCQVRILNRDNSPTSSMRRYEGWINHETLSTEQIHALRFVEFPLVNPTILAHRRYFELGFCHDGYPEDYDLMLRAAALGFRFGKVDDILLDWFDNPDRLTRNDPRYSDAAFMACRREHLLAGPLAGHETIDLWGAGQTGKPWLRWLQDERRTVRRVYDVNPRKIGRNIHGVPVVAPNFMPPPDNIPLIIAVGAAGARPLIQSHIEHRGYVSGKDAWFVA